VHFLEGGSSVRCTRCFRIGEPPDSDGCFERFLNVVLPKCGLALKGSYDAASEIDLLVA
jgi:hypothetical protein